jgi:hypothetical protein
LACLVRRKHWNSAEIPCRASCYIASRHVFEADLLLMLIPRLARGFTNRLLYQKVITNGALM